MSNFLAITVEDVNGDQVPNAEVVVRDLGSITKAPLSGFLHYDRPGEPPKHVFDLGNIPKLSIELKAPQYFGYTLELQQNPSKGTYEINARSPEWGLFSLEPSPGLMASLRLVVRRVQQAPRKMPPSAPRADARTPIVDDPGGIWIDPNRRLVGLFDSSVSGFPVLLKTEVAKDASSDTWGRFHAADVDVNLEESGAGTWFDWLEYGDPNGFRLLVAIWVVNRSGARIDKKVDFLFFFCPRTDIDFYGPPHVYPYKRKRLKETGDIIQPYSGLGYYYLSPGGARGADFGIAYQAMACKRSLVVVMPLNAFGFWGPLLCQEGLCRLAKEVASYVGDNTKNTLPASSQFALSQRQMVNRIAISAYSAGAADALKLFGTRTIPELVDSYKSARDDKQAQDFAKRLAALTPSLWQSRAPEFKQRWAEFYSVDGFFGTNTEFPAAFGDWFLGDADRILRVYATPGRMKSGTDTVSTKLAGVFKGVSPKLTERADDAAFSAQEWHRSDNRASLVWFSEPYMRFNSVPFMPTQDDHHTIPRVVFSHAVSQSKLLQV